MVKDSTTPVQALRVAFSLPVRDMLHMVGLTLRSWFGEHLPGSEVRLVRPKESWVDDPELRARIEADGDAAILGVGL